MTDSSGNVGRRILCMGSISAACLLIGSGNVLAYNDLKLPDIPVKAEVQQNKTITVVVTDEMGPVTGANVLIKGTTNGTITDMNGNAVIENVPNNAIVVVSFIGYTTQEIPVGNQSKISVKISEDTQRLDEVVVVGYGTQSKKDITGSVAVVSSEALSETPVATFAEALQGKASGVYISSSGAPGAETTIRIRGVGSVNGSDPLIVVDGVSNVDIDSVNPNDIESLQVLKDASATAIYGAQGANGVIIITTKQGTKSGRVRVSYDGYVGFAKMANDGFDLLDAWEAMEFQATGLVNLRDIRHQTTGLTHTQFGALDANDQLHMPYAIKPSGLSEQQIVEQYGSVANWEASYLPDGNNSWSRSAYAQMLHDGYSEAEARKGTNWYDQIVQTGLVQQHNVSVLGGGEKGTYSMAAGYMKREGTIKASYFERYSVRANTNFNATKWLTLGQNTNVAVMEFGGDRGGQADDTPFAKTYTMQPWVPVYNIGGDFAGSQAAEGGRDISAVHQVDKQMGDWTRMFRGQTALYAEIKPFADLSIRSQFSARLWGRWARTFNEIDIFANKEGTSNNSLNENAQWSFSWQWTNTATYNKTINEDHKIQAVLGTETMSLNNGRELSGQRIDFIFEDDENTWILNNGAAANLSNTGLMKNNFTMFGIFFRGDYSYKGKYLGTFTVRRDASSKFSPNNRWGTFPSASVGWRISDEPFMEKTRKYLDDLKIRAGYGTTGNSNIGEYNYVFQYATGDQYMYPISGSDTDASPGFLISALGDVNAKWETTKMFNIGFDATALNNRLTASFDYYIKKTSDMLVDANWSALAGNATFPKINIGDMENKGVDFSIGWSDKIGKVKYNINANVSTYRNKVTKLGSSDIFSSTRLDKVNITTVGQPVGMFYGYKIDGIYQNADDVLNYKNANGQSILPYAVTDQSALNADDWVGRYKIADTNNDGKINADDKTIIGNPHPDFTGGINIGLTWNNFDLSTYLYFSVGNDIFRHYMYYTHYGALQSNYSRDRRDNSWSPSNPDGIYPLYATSTGEGTEAANESNSMYIQDGSYLRMQNLTVGYSLPKKWMQKIKFERIRVYLQFSNVFTITGYDGLDPEIRSGSDLAKGRDYGGYGMPRQFLLGLNVQF